MFSSVICHSWDSHETDHLQHAAWSIWINIRSPWLLLSGWPLWTVTTASWHYPRDDLSRKSVTDRTTTEHAILIGLLLILTLKCKSKIYKFIILNWILDSKKIFIETVILTINVSSINLLVNSSPTMHIEILKYVKLTNHLLN